MIYIYIYIHIIYRHVYCVYIPTKIIPTDIA